LLKRADTRGRADIIYICNAYRYFVGQAVIDIKKVGHAENI